MASEGVKKLSLGVLLLTVVFALSWGQVLVDRVVASVNGEPILETDVKLGMVFYNTNSRRVVIEKLTEDWLLSQYVESKGGNVSDELLDRMIADLAKANNKSLEQFFVDLQQEGISSQDLRSFLRRIILATQALDVLLARDIRVSDLELEVEKLKRGDVKVVRDVELLVVDKRDAQRLANLMEKEKNLEEIAKALGLKVERLSVSKGELVERLDVEVWRAPKGELVFAEDEKHIYVARVLGQRETTEGVDVDALREEIFRKKLESARKELLEKLKKRSFIRMVG